MKTPMTVVYAAWRLLNLLERTDRGREATVKRICQLAYLLGKPPWDTEVAPPELAQAIKGTAAGRALDLGCGTGTNSVYLARHGWDVVGVDMVKSALRRAKVKAHAAGVRPEFLRGDVTRLDQLPTGTDFSLFFDRHSAASPGRLRGRYHRAGEVRGPVVAFRLRARRAERRCVGDGSGITHPVHRLGIGRGNPRHRRDGDLVVHPAPGMKIPAAQQPRPEFPLPVRR